MLKKFKEFILSNKYYIIGGAALMAYLYSSYKAASNITHTMTS
jgi:hypothetical protein